MAVQGGSSQSDRREEAQRKDTSRRGWQLPGGHRWNHRGVAARDGSGGCSPLPLSGFPTILLMGPFVLGSHSPPFPISRCACIFNRSPTDSQHQVMPQVLLGAQ